MSKVTIKLNQKGVREMLRSSEMMSVCKEHADATRAGCGTGYEVSTHRGVNRVNAQVSAESFFAKHDNMKNNTILKALR